MGGVNRVLVAQPFSCAHNRPEFALHAVPQGRCGLAPSHHESGNRGGHVLGRRRAGARYAWIPGSPEVLVVAVRHRAVDGWSPPTLQSGCRGIIRGVSAWRSVYRSSSSSRCVVSRRFSAVRSGVLRP